MIRDRCTSCDGYDFFFSCEMSVFLVQSLETDSTVHSHHVAMSVLASHNIVVNFGVAEVRALAQKAEISSRKANGLRYAGVELIITPSGYKIILF